LASRGVESLVSDFADDTTNPSTDANGSPALSAARTAIDDGLKIARGCGFGLYHIDLQLELARLRLLQGNPSEALAALRTALDETRPKNAETGAPELLAALAPCCGYAWPVPEALQLRAEALLLQAAQELQAVGWAEPASPTTPADCENWWDSLRSAHPTTWQFINDAVANLNEALDLWRNLRDTARKNANYRISRKQYNYRAAETHKVLTDLDSGILTGYPLRPESDGGMQSSDIAPPTEQGITTVRDQVFISYSHLDQDWLDKLLATLKPLTRKQAIDVWSDKRIKTAAKWKDEITEALSRAKVAVLLVSRNFLASDFIADEEIPPILAAAKSEGLTIVWVPIGASLYEETDIADYQAAHDPNKPLNGLTEAELDSALVSIAKEIRDAATP
jgi:hypothetical protein